MANAEASGEERAYAASRLQKIRPKMFVTIAQARTGAGAKYFKPLNLIARREY
jgi:hypothetical protein